MKANFHTHCNYCDGQNTIEEMVKSAVSKKFTHLGFSSHAPLLRDFDFLIKEDNLENYVKEIKSIENKNIKLYAGLENDFVPALNKPFEYYKSKYDLDYIIGGVHLVKPLNKDELWFIDGHVRDTYIYGLRTLFAGNIKKAVTQFWEQTFEMIEIENFDIIAHIDKIKMHNQNEFFHEDEKWYQALAAHSVNLIYNKNIIMEINSRGIYKNRCKDFYPSDYILNLASKKNIPFVISSDAHHVDDLGMLYEESADKLKSFGLNILNLSSEFFK